MLDRRHQFLCPVSGAQATNRDNTDGILTTCRVIGTTGRRLMPVGHV